MSVVVRGVPDGEDIMLNFGGDAKKKVFMYWKPGRTHFCTHQPFEGGSNLLFFGIADFLNKYVVSGRVISHCRLL